ncbi:hypothetical protein NSTC745_06319 [Nostoc sp. DSM 114161]|jgi:hypothetical protein
MEQFLKEAIGLGSPQLEVEPPPTDEPQPQPSVTLRVREFAIDGNRQDSDSLTIYDFGKLLAQNEPPKKSHGTKQ